MHLVINGQPRDLAELSAGATLADLVSALQLKSDRVAIEQNGLIVARPQWATMPIHSGDRMEIVHFVGGGGFAAAQKIASGFPTPATGLGK